jgi:hypothetical protein
LFKQGNKSRQCKRALRLITVQRGKHAQAKRVVATGRTSPDVTRNTIEFAVGLECLYRFAQQVAGFFRYGIEVTQQPIRLARGVWLFSWRRKS